jgi:hypothetical protein
MKKKYDEEERLQVTNLFILEVTETERKENGQILLRQ